MLDPQKYFEAQDEYGYVRILNELRNEEKEGHWIWFVFPQIGGLGKSPESEYYAIHSLHEAEEYLANASLRARLIAAMTTLYSTSTTTEVEDIVGHLDAMKIRSCLTLFEQADDLGGVSFAQVLDEKFDGMRCQPTLAILGM